MWPEYPTSTSTETDPDGKIVRPAPLQGKIMERLRDNDADWGLTRMAYAAQTRRMMRNRAIRLPSRAIVVVADEDPIALHETTSGQLAYQVKRHDAIISLPWVSILGEGLAQ